MNKYDKRAENDKIYSKKVLIVFAASMMTQGKTSNCPSIKLRFKKNLTAYFLSLYFFFRSMTVISLRLKCFLICLYQ